MLVFVVLGCADDPIRSKPSAPARSFDDEKAAKTQIFIYKALEDAEKSHLHGR